LENPQKLLSGSICNVSFYLLWLTTLLMATNLLSLTDYCVVSQHFEMCRLYRSKLFGCVHQTKWN